MPFSPGSPPRVRSRLELRASVPPSERITSACAEQTTSSSPVTTVSSDHLRVCGADGLFWGDYDDMQGSPPRVRSRRRVVKRGHGGHGITSACAEQTRGGVYSPSVFGDHLRVCGADVHVAVLLANLGGSPPRVRSRLRVPHRPHTETGITSACAEQTALGYLTCRVRRDHLRVCGADTFRSVASFCVTGSPPRVRSRQRVHRRHLRRRGITSACAEQTPMSSWLAPST